MSGDQDVTQGSVGGLKERRREYNSIVSLGPRMGSKEDRHPERMSRGGLR